MKEEERIKLWLALYEEGEINDGECYIDDLHISQLLHDEFGLSFKKADKETLMLMAWGVIEKSDREHHYRRNKSWKPSLGMLLLDRMDERQLITGRTSQVTEEREAMGKEKMRGYKCPECGKPLIEGLEFQFPPRLSYWYCSKCQLVFRETDKGNVALSGNVEGNERLCIQEEEIRGFVQDGDGRKTYPDTL